MKWLLLEGALGLVAAAIGMWFIKRRVDKYGSIILIASLMPFSIRLMLFTNNALGFSLPETIATLIGVFVGGIAGYNVREAVIGARNAQGNATYK